MVATRGRTFKRPWRRSCHSSKLKSSSAPIGRKDSRCFHVVGSSNAPLLGSTAAEGLQRIGRTSIATRWHSCGLPQSASCSENFVIPPDVFGQTLSTEHLFVPMALVTQWEVAMRDLSARCVMGAMLSLALVSSAGAVTFTFEFDDRGIFAPPPALPPFVGTGTVTLATDPGPGTFALNSLGPFSMSFVFGTNTFFASNASTSEITTPLSQVLVALTSVPGGEN